MVSYIAFGEPLAEFSPESIRTDRARHMLEVCRLHRDFHCIEQRRRDVDGASEDIIVVDCCNDQVPSHNKIGIKNRERLALVFPVDATTAPSVRALRADFPVTMHQNHMPSGEPASLCLYFESWSAIERVWTPQYHLQQVLWWLRETAKETLHRDDQPVERLYFESPVEVILPPEFREKHGEPGSALVLTASGSKSECRKILSGFFLPKAEVARREWPSVVPLLISLPPMIHGRVERFPCTLGELEQQLGQRNIVLFDKIRDKIRDVVPSQGIKQDPNSQVVLIFDATLKRNEDAVSEAVPPWGFIISKDLAHFGEMAGVLDGRTGNYCCVNVLGQELERSNEWSDLPIAPISVTTRLSLTSARAASGITGPSATFEGILAGVGALGSALAEIWSREAWGAWTIVDHDLVKAHNIARHVAKDCHVGHFKVTAVKSMLEANYHPGCSTVQEISCSVVTQDNEKLRAALAKAKFVIDATTTLEVPRDLSQRDDVPRMASAFITPSGNGSVLLMEDDERLVPLLSLEAQYYRAVINESWGSHHLAAHRGHLWVGGGCRDLSAVIPIESIQVHAATLARQIRVARDQSAPRIRVWSCVPETGGIEVFTPSVSEILSQECGSWRVLWDRHIRAQLHQIRRRSLPNETGGIILGYIDQKLKTIFIVDVRPAPPDSHGDRRGFVRGISGLSQEIEEAKKRTAHIVGYIGEWHSHPQYASARPSGDDQSLLQYLADTLARDGQPALMLIVGEDEVRLAVQKA